jgi:hypothetical protein
MPGDSKSHADDLTDAIQFAFIEEFGADLAAPSLAAPLFDHRNWEFSS